MEDDQIARALRDLVANQPRETSQILKIAVPSLGIAAERILRVLFEPGSGLEFDQARGCWDLQGGRRRIDSQNPSSAVASSAAKRPARAVKPRVPPPRQVLASGLRLIASKTPRSREIPRTNFLKATDDQASIRLSKSKFMLGRQCLRLLWWSVHERDAPELVRDPVLQLRVRQGKEVGSRILQLFPDAVAFESRKDTSQWAAETSRAMRLGAERLIEPGFEVGGVFVAADGMERLTDGSWRILEFKATTKVKPYHIADIAFQHAVIEKAGVRVSQDVLVYLDRECRDPSANAASLLVGSDVSGSVSELRASEDFEGQVREMRIALSQPQVPTVPTGGHCARPFPCPFFERCWPTRTEDSVQVLYRLPLAKKAELIAGGTTTISDAAAQREDLSATQSRQAEAIDKRELRVAPELRARLQQLEFPIAFLDFETIASPIPRWNGVAPYEAIPVLFSSHVLDSPDATAVHCDWLAEREADPRPAIAAEVIRALSRARTVVVYSIAMERGCIRRLAEAVPRRARALESLEVKLFDLLPLVRRHSYHPGYLGSFGLKAVRGALLAGQGDGDEPESGMLASAMLESFYFPQAGEQSEEAIAERVRRYCRRDTESLMDLFRFFLSS